MNRILGSLVCVTLIYFALPGACAQGCGCTSCYNISVSTWGDWARYAGVNGLVQDLRATAIDDNGTPCPSECNPNACITLWNWDPLPSESYGCETGFSPADSWGTTKYSAPGIYDIDITANDDDNQSGTDFYRIYVGRLTISGPSCVPAGGVVTASITVEPSNLPGSLELKLASPGADAIQVYADSGLTNLIIACAGDSYVQPVSRFPRTIYIKGWETGLLSDVLFIEWRPTGDTWYVPAARDSMIIRVVDVALDKVATGNTPD